MDDASLSEREQRILEEIERHTVAEDADFVRRVRTAGPRRDALRLLRLSILAAVVGVAMLLGFTISLTLGIAGFLLALAGIVGIGTSVRSLSSSGRAPGTSVRDAFGRVGSKLRRPPRP